VPEARNVYRTRVHKFIFSAHLWATDISLLRSLGVLLSAAFYKDAAPDGAEPEPFECSRLMNIAPLRG